MTAFRSTAVLAAALLSACSTPVAPPERAARADAETRAERPQNLILLIADGFGPASATMGRAAKGAPLAFDSLLVGSVETSATDSRVTDSAASATAYACGVKTYNGAIGMDADGAPCTTILERAEAAGMSTGLVATSRITHATPASFAAHVPRRSQEAEIAEQMLASGVDLLLGGGAMFFSSREDGRDLLAGAVAAAPVALATPADLDGLDALGDAPTVGLFATGHLDYEIDRDAGQPSLATMTRRALDLLDAHAGDAGFFVMVEGSRIDHAGHGNDPAGHLHDILAYDAAVAEALRWAAADGETLVVSTADHETGGLSLGADGVYAWDPAPLLAATMSAERLARLDRERAGALMDAWGEDAPETADADLAASTDALLRQALGDAPDAQYEPETPRPVVHARYTRLLSERARVGWTTGGHTAVDVGLYAFGPGAERLSGAMPNDALGRRLRTILLGD